MRLFNIKLSYTTFDLPSFTCLCFYSRLSNFRRLLAVPYLFLLVWFKWLNLVLWFKV